MSVKSGVNAQVNRGSFASVQRPWFGLDWFGAEVWRFHLSWTSLEISLRAAAGSGEVIVIPREVEDELSRRALCGGCGAGSTGAGSFVSPFKPQRSLRKTKELWGTLRTLQLSPAQLRSLQTST